MAAAAMLGGCAAEAPFAWNDSPANVQSVETGVGAILGGVAGGVIGHQVGRGLGNVAATILGAVGGAVVGTCCAAMMSLRDMAQRLVATVAQFGPGHVDRGLVMGHHHRDEVRVDIARRRDLHGRHHFSSWRHRSRRGKPFPPNLRQALRRRRQEALRTTPRAGRGQGREGLAR